MVATTAPAFKPWSTSIPRQRDLGDQVSDEGIEPLEVAILVRNDMREEGTEVPVSRQLAAERVLLGFVPPLEASIISQIKSIKDKNRRRFSGLRAARCRYPLGMIR